MDKSSLVAIALLLIGNIQLIYSAAVNPFASGSPLFSTSSKLDNLHVKCDVTGLYVTLSFNKPFPGIIYSLGHQAIPSCNYVNSTTAGLTNVYTFFISVGRCGTVGRYTEPKEGEKVVVKNTIVLQHDPDFITAEDSAHALSCTWAHSYIKPVSTKPVQVEDDGNNKVFPVVLDPISTQSGQVLNRIHIENGLASGTLQDNGEKSVIITVVDPLDQYDAVVLDCMAFDSDGGNAVALTDKNGCMLQLSVLPPFKKFRNSGQSLTLHSTLKNGKLSQVPNIRVKCNIEVCRGQCRTPCQIATSDINTKTIKVI
ncbi:hypothetical protein CHUAL_011267 [Chamberlinius hualienensis]